MPEPSSGPSGPTWERTPVPFEKTLDGTLGFEMLELSEKSARPRHRPHQAEVGPRARRYPWR
jgi:hypothetical protein